MSNQTSCPHRPACDGCPSFENPETAFSEKVTAVTERMKRYGLHEWPEPQPAAQGRTLGYRNRARMVVDHMRLGFYQAGSREVLPIDACLVHEDAVERVLKVARESPALPSAQNIDVRANAAGQAIATFGFAAAPTSEQRETLEKLASERLSVHVNIGTSAAYLSGEQLTVAGADTLDLSVSGQTFKVPPRAFFQVNTEVLEQIHGVVRPFVAGSETLWDLYCGVGVHGLCCASEHQTIRGFDIDEAGVTAAQSNADRLGVAASYVVAADADFDDWDASGNAIVNPARAGLSPELPRRIASKIARVAYVSCEPETFLRDAERLANQGFAMRELHAFDMMPRTAHIELVGLFEQAGLQPRWSALAGGLTGAEGQGEQTWVALVDGSVPRHATLPGGQVKLERLRSIGDAAVVRLHVPEGVEVVEVMSTLKRWKHPVIGDEQGNRAANFRWRQSAHLDAPALHRTRVGAGTAPVPDFLLGVFRLPRHIVDP